MIGEISIWEYWLAEYIDFQSVLIDLRNEIIDLLRLKEELEARKKSLKITNL